MTNKVDIIGNYILSVLKFDNGDKANRALKNLPGCMVGHRKLVVEYNDRLSLGKSRASSSSPRRPVASVEGVSTAVVDPRFCPLSVQRVNVVKGLASSRRVRHGSTSSNEEAPAKSNSKASRPRRSRRGQGSRNNSPQEAQEIANSLGILDIGDESDNDSSSTTNSDVVIILTSDTPLQPRFIDNILNDDSLRVKSMSQESKWKCLATVQDLNAGRSLIDSLDGATGPGKIAARFQDFRHERDANVASLISDQPNGKMDLFPLLREYQNKYGCPLDLESLKHSSIVNLNEDDRTVSLLKGKIRKNRKGVPKSTATVHFNDGACTSSSAVNSYSNSPLCSHHDRRAQASDDFVLPTVVAKLGTITDLLDLALKEHPQGLHLESLLFCLNAMTSSPKYLIRVAKPEDGGVPLEQLVEATEMVERVQEGHVTFLRRKIAATWTSPRSKSLGEKQLELRILELLETADQHRLLRNDVMKKYQKKFGSDIDSEVSGYGGLDTFFNDLADTFFVFGKGSLTTVTLSLKYQKSIFLLSLRKMVSAVKSKDKFLPLDDLKAFEKSYLSTFSHPLDLGSFGVCYLSDILELAMNTNQNLVSFEDDLIRHTLEMREFYQHTVELISTRKGFSCSLANFDEMYVTKYGAYNMNSMAFRSLVEFCQELSHEFEISLGKPKTIRFTEKHQRKVLQESFMALLNGLPKKSIELDKFEEAFHHYHHRSLSWFLDSLPEKTIPDIVRTFEAESRIVVSESHISLLSISALSVVDFVCATMIVLLNAPPDHQMDTESAFKPEYAKLFMADASEGLNTILPNLPKLPETFLIQFEVGGRALIKLFPHAAVLCQIVSVFPPDLGLDCDQVKSLYESSFNQALNLHQFDSVLALCKSLPFLVKVTDGKICLNHGGQVFQQLSQNLSFSGDKGCQSSRRVLLRPKQKERKRMAANLR